ncbi:galectin-5-like [Dendropsophus ebraccatus]|uniref:galectin-5-like n=1 Tax=Dendropsophus ebraccatus TaxID=150705 RepID=UPI0038320312
MTLYKPKQPYRAFFMANFGPNENVLIMGNIPDWADRFAVNLMNSKTGDISFHFNPRIDENKISRNTWKNGSWGDEEAETPIMPFQRGKSFTMEIRNEGKAIAVYGDGEKLCSYKHRLPFKDIDVIEIVRDVNLTMIKL